MGFLDWLKEILCNDSECEKRAVEWQNKALSFEQQVGELQDSKQEQYDILSEKLRFEAFELEKAKQKILELSSGAIAPYHGNHVEAQVSYSRHMIVQNQKIIFTPIDVRQFVTPNNFTIISNLEKEKLLYDGARDLDELIPKIYGLAKRNYKYTDDIVFGFGEVWLFPFELQELLKNQGIAGDCDDWSNYIASHFAAAGIPRERFWVSCGDTRSGYGHSTVYAKDNDGKWHHLNSTSPAYSHNSLKQYPSKDDESDSVGIKKDGFWFSFNDYWSISDFTTSSSGLKKIPKIKISRKKHV